MFKFLLSMGTTKFLVQLYILCFISVCFAQKTAVYSNDEVHFSKALSLYRARQFKSAQQLFKSLESHSSDSFLKSNVAYYVANCAVKLRQPNAETLIESFVKNYPYSSKRTSAYFDIASYYFENAKFAQACKWYDRVDLSSLPNRVKETYYFNYGYSLYATRSYKKASLNLNKVESSIRYGSQAKYYMGFMAYESNDYTQASAYFDQLNDSRLYQKNMSYYQADLNFKLGNFQKAIALATVLLEDTSEKEASELSKIIGESYFNLQNYTEAIPYLQAYKGQAGRWSHTDFYQLGYAFYKQNNYQNSIDEFNKIIEGNNAIAQNAYYHLAECYINLNKKQAALNAFKNASEMEFTPSIKEDAWLNYAKLSYDIGNPYQSTSEVLAEFLNLYPKSAFKTEVESLLIDSYINSNNYVEALVLLENKSKPIHKAALQKVTFFRALELYNEGSYAASEALLIKSLSVSLDPVIKARATYWKAEVDYQLMNYDKALIGFLDFSNSLLSAELEEVNNLNYNIAYTYFKQKHYAKAINYFQLFTAGQSKDFVMLNDAFLRMADSYFVGAQYSLAIEGYQAAMKLNKIEQDYATFQIAVSHGYLGQLETKIKGLKSLIGFKNSSLKDQALFELANSYANQGNPGKALQKYTALINDFSSSILVPKALLRRGLIEYNKNDTSAALKSFNAVALGYPSTPEAFQAISSSRSIYIDLGQVDAYELWLKTLDYSEVNDSELEAATYEAAEKKYLDANNSKAIELFNGYIARFPKGKELLKAHFYLAELYYKNNLKPNALPHYNYVCKQATNEFTEAALLNISEISLESNDFEAALTVLSRLESEAKKPQNRLYAQSNLMKVYFQFENYAVAIRYAETILDNSKTDAYIKSDAYIIIARAAMQTDNEPKARKAYTKVKAIASGETAAESQYFEAYFKHTDGAFEASNESIQVLIKNYSSYKYFASKGLVIMAKNFYALDDVFQASYILENVIQNFADFEDIVLEASLELERIKSEAAKTNSSLEIEPQNKN